MDKPVKPLNLKEILGPKFNTEPGGVNLISDKELKDLTNMHRDPLLSTRQQTHGDFAENARISQSLKAWFREAVGWDRLSDVEREAMDMIALKFSRILSGKSMSKEHWEDVVGYAKLVEEQCK